MNDQQLIRLLTRRLRRNRHKLEEVMSTIAEFVADDDELAGEVQTLITAYLALKNNQTTVLSPEDQAAVDAADGLIRQTQQDAQNALDVTPPAPAPAPGDGGVPTPGPTPGAGV